MKAILFLTDCKEKRATYIRFSIGSLFIPLSSSEHIRNWCLENGRSLEGCIASARYFLGNIKKAPIFINADCCFFPLRDNDSGSTLWINAPMLRKVSQVSPNLSKVFFNNNEDIIICVNTRVVLKQLNRCRFLTKALARIVNF